MIATTSTQRTAIRDAVLAALQFINTDKSGTYYAKQVSLSPFFLEVTECVGYPTYCVILTDEELTYDMMREATASAKLMIVGYVKSQTDPRKELDQAIEDARFALTTNEPLRKLVRLLLLEAITTDEATTAALPHGQFVMTWKLTFTRPMSFAG